MRELPILFIAPMIRAILDGRKTVTRRVVKPQPPARNGIVNAAYCGHPDVWLPTGNICDDTPKRWTCPYGRPGDRLWVRETHALEHDVEGGEPTHADGRPILRRPDDDVDGILPLWTQPHYRATDPAPDLCCDREGCAQCRDHDMGPHWRPAIHMPRWASRITLEVTAVRVEWLQDISYEQALAEGAMNAAQTIDHFQPGGEETGDETARRLRWPQRDFELIWESINGAGSWAANPHVWVVEFRRVEVP